MGRGPFVHDRRQEGDVRTVTVPGLTGRHGAAGHPLGEPVAVDHHVAVVGRSRELRTRSAGGRIAEGATQELGRPAVDRRISEYEDPPRQVGLGQTGVIGIEELPGNRRRPAALREGRRGDRDEECDCSEYKQKCEDWLHQIPPKLGNVDCLFAGHACLHSDSLLLHAVSVVEHLSPGVLRYLELPGCQG